MFNPLNLFSKIIKTGNQKELDRIQKIVDQINKLEKNLEKLDNTEFPKKTLELIQKLENGQTTNEILPNDEFNVLKVGLIVL